VTLNSKCYETGGRHHLSDHGSDREIRHIPARSRPNYRPAVNPLILQQMVLDVKRDGTLPWKLLVLCIAGTRHSRPMLLPDHHARCHPAQTRRRTSDVKWWTTWTQSPLLPGSSGSYCGMRRWFAVIWAIHLEHL